MPCSKGGTGLGGQALGDEVCIAATPETTESTISSKISSDIKTTFLLPTPLNCTKNACKTGEYAGAHCTGMTQCQEIRMFKGRGLY